MQARQSELRDNAPALSVMPSKMQSARLAADFIFAERKKLARVIRVPTYENKHNST